MEVIIDARTTQDEIKLNGVGRYSRAIIEHLILNNTDTKFTLIMYDNDSTIDGVVSKSENVQIVRIGRYDEGSFWNMIKHNLDIVFHIKLNRSLKSIDKKNAVFFSPYFWKGLPVFILPTISVIHDFALPVFNIYSTISPIHNLLRFIHYWFELIRVYFAKHIIVDAIFTVTELKRFLPFLNKKKITVIPLGIYEDKEEGSIDSLLPLDWSKRGYFIYLGGGLTKNKNSKGVVRGYLEFVNRLKSKGIKLTDMPYLVIAGKNFKPEYSREAKKFEDYVQKLGIRELVHFTGKYEDSVRWQLVRNSNGFIHLSTYEGFGFAVAEALRAKVPVIAHRGSTYIEVVGDGGLLVNGLDSNEVAQVLLKVWEDKEYSRDVAQKGYEKSLEYDWNITAKKTFKIIKDVHDRYYSK